jgi:hypothetical protein
MLPSFRMKLFHRALVAVLTLIGALPSVASAQIFLASKPHPDFAVGPLFVIANVRPDLSVTVNLSFSLTLRQGAARSDMEQDLFLLWPAEVSEPTAPGPADPTLARDLHDGLMVLNSGRLVLRSRDRTLVGTGQLGEELPEVASYVTVTRRGPLGSQINPVTYIKIPWTPKLADPLIVTTLVMPMRGLVTPKPASWVAETFWGRRWILTIGFGDLGSPVMPLYSIYFEHRDRVVRLAREFSQAIATFSDSDHLLIDGIEPPAATRRPSRVRAGSEVVALSLTPMEGIAPQNVQVQFSYFSGRIAWRPILVSLALLLLTNVAGAIMFGREMFGVVRARRRARAAAGRLRAEWLTGDAQATALVGNATYDDVVARWGPPDEHRERLSTPGRRTMVYRARSNGQAHEVEIEIADGRVTEIERRVYRVMP